MYYCMRKNNIAAFKYILRLIVVELAGLFYRYEFEK